MTVNVQIFWKTQEENWKYLWNPPCHAKGCFIPVSRKWCKAMAIKKFKNNVWLYSGISCIHETATRTFCSPKFMKIALQETELLLWHITVCCTSLFTNHKRWRFRMQKLPWTRNGKTRDCPSMEFGESQEQEGAYSGSTKRQKIRSILPHWWTYVTSKMRSWNQNYRSTKAESCSGEDIVEYNFGAYAFLLNRSRLRPRWLPQQSWVSLTNWEVVTDKHLMQYLLVLGKIWRMLPDCFKLPNRNVQMFGYVFHHTNGQNNGETLKTLWYFLNETCTVTH